MSLQIGREMLGVNLPIDIINSIRLWALAESKSVTSFLIDDIFGKLITNNHDLIDPYDEDRFIDKIVHDYLKAFEPKGIAWMKENLELLVDEFEKLLHRKKLSQEHIYKLRNRLKIVVEELDVQTRG